LTGSGIKRGAIERGARIISRQQKNKKSRSQKCETQNEKHWRIIRGS
jgi:hypothetical protein